MIYVTVREITKEIDLGDTTSIPIHERSGRIPVDDVKYIINDIDPRAGCIIALKSGGFIKVGENIDTINKRYDSAIFVRKLTEERALEAARKP